MPLSSLLPQSPGFPLGVYEVEQVESDESLEGGLTDYLKAHPLVAALIDGEHVYPYFVPRHVEQGQFPCIVYSVTEQPVESITGQAGVATVSIDLECWSPVFDTSCKLATAVRKSLQAFRGWFGCCAVAGIWYQGIDDDAEKPSDDSGVYWFCRTVSFDVSYVVPLHTF